MKIRSLIQQGVDQVWTLLGSDILDTVTVTHFVRGTYVPSTGAVPTTSTSKTVKAARIDDNAALPTDTLRGDRIQNTRSYLVRAKDLPFEPAIGDTIARGNKVFRISKAESHADIAWELILER